MLLYLMNSFIAVCASTVVSLVCYLVRLCNVVCYVSKMIAIVHCMQLCKPNDICIKMWYMLLLYVGLVSNSLANVQELEVHLMSVSACSFCTTALHSFACLLQ